MDERLNHDQYIKDKKEEENQRLEKSKEGFYQYNPRNLKPYVRTCHNCGQTHPYTWQCIFPTSMKSRCPRCLKMPYHIPFDCNEKIFNCYGTAEFAKEDYDCSIDAEKRKLAYAQRVLQNKLDDLE